MLGRIFGCGQSLYGCHGFALLSSVNLSKNYTYDCSMRCSCSDFRFNIGRSEIRAFGFHGESPSSNDLCVPGACIRTVSGPNKSCHHPRTALAKRFYALTDPVEDAREVKFLPIQLVDPWSHK